MFTGIIEDIGKISRINKSGDSYSLEIISSKITDSTEIGDSIATDGVCLTVTAVEKDIFTVDVMEETLNRTTLKEAVVGREVNLERAVTPATKLGGHLVTGHIDTVGTITEKSCKSNGCLLAVKVPEDLLKYIAPKGSVAIDGISLTVIKVENDTFSVGIIPHTMNSTTLHNKNNNSKVNIEVDLISRYVVNYIDNKKNVSKLDWDAIARKGI